MRQQVNLYRGRLVDRPQPLSSRQVIPLLVLVTVILVALAGYSHWRALRLEQQQARLTVHLAAQRELLTQVEKQFPVRKPSPLLQSHIARLERELQLVTRSLNLTLTQEQGHNAQILSSLRGLAGRHQPGLWLRRIKLGRQGQQVELSGRALDPQLVSVYLQWLTDEQVFADLLFSRLQLTRMQEEPEYVEFTLMTGPDQEN